MRTVKQSGNRYGMMVIGIVTGLVLSILSAAVSAVFVDNGTIKIDAVRYISFFVWITSSLLCAYIAGSTGEGNLLVRCGISTGVYYGILLCIGIVVFDGVNKNIILGSVGSLLGYIIAVILLSKTRRAPVGRKMRKFKRK